ncbi:short-chain dehydrogenase/reductase-like protein [Leptodontidium sp. 2 PMI_412]|nr:short-chain dehydrogenase/reductase-like protein [Leptodontidium sp. MPI-SDFR-AT-0119]KAH9214749.1 short-chain dehydrogenase/reductase-like protein [Leptodontidium sp. 2 PMI_412]
MWSPFAAFNLPKDFLGSFLKSQWTTLLYPATDFTGQTLIVTGSNVGLGLEAARHFVRLGATKVILACRSQEKGESAKRDIEKSTKRSGVLEVWQVDLGYYESVKQFCNRAASLQRLDAVVENAGIATSFYTELEGRESTVTVNVISTFLMALLLLPKLRVDAIKYNSTPRLVIVASEAHEQARFVEQSSASIFPTLNDPRYQQDRYNVSKLLEILTVRELAPAMTASGKPKVTLNCLTPGFCHSELMRDAPFPLNILAPIGKFFLARTTEVGSRTLVSAAAASEDTHGMYLQDLMIKEPSRWVRSEKGKEAQKKVYIELLDILEEIEPGITNNI